MADDDDETRTGWLRRRSSGRTPPIAREREMEPRLLAHRYALVKKLGAGGMGVVYEAHDRQLDREVAIKLLHPEAAVTHARRLLREAQTLARLSHPNLVPVFDVGWAGDELFVAMELVRGRSLGPGIEPWREALRLLVEAGRGLEHAHRSGLVHRDFKPTNVLVGDDGRARVADFGLARPIRGGSVDRNGSDAHDLARDELLTRPGSNPGTPAYMPPELDRGGTFDERSDQFSFCVTAWEVLYGARPARDRSTGAVITAVSPTSAVPRFIRRALERGLASNPEDRHASMHELLRELDPNRRRLRAPGIALAGAGVLVGGVAYAGLAEPRPCEGIERELEGIHDHATRTRIRTAAETELPRMTELHDAIDARIEDYAAQWSAQRRETCVANKVEHRESDALFDRRMRCLDERRDALRGVVQVLADGATRDTILSAPRAIAALPSIAVCADDEALLASSWQPASPEERELARALHTDLGRVQALFNTGQFVAAMPEAEALRQRSRELPSSPVDAKAQLLWASLRGELDDHEAAFDGFKQAAVTAAACRDDETLASAWLSVVAILARDHARAQEFETVASVVEGLVERLSAPAPARARLLDGRAQMARSIGDLDQAVAHAIAAVELLASADVDDPLLLSHLQSTAGLTLVDAGRYDEAITYFEQAIATSGRALTPTHPRIGSDLLNLSLVQPPDRAEATQERAVEIMRAAFPNGHSDLALTLANLGLTYLNRGAYAKAEATLHEALAMQRRAYPDGHEETSHTLVTLADTLNEAGRREEALAFAEEGLAMRRAVLPADHPNIGRALRLLGAIQFDEGNILRARDHYEEALAVFERSLPDDHPLVAGALNGIGQVAVSQRDGTRAIEACERALEIERKARGDDALDLVPHLSCIAAGHQDLGQPELAVPLLERSLVLWSNVDVGPLLPAQIKLQLATALDHVGRDRDRVIELATAVLAVAEAHPESRGRLADPARKLIGQRSTAAGSR